MLPLKCACGPRKLFLGGNSKLPARLESYLYSTASEHGDPWQIISYAELRENARPVQRI